MGKLKQMIIEALEDYDDVSEYDFYMQIEDLKKKKRQEQKSRRSEEDTDLD